MTMSTYINLIII